MKNYINEDVVICPNCGCSLDKNTLYRMDCICLECGRFIDIDELEAEQLPDDLWSDFGEAIYEDYYEELFNEKEDEAVESKDDKKNESYQGTFMFRFMSDLDYETIKKSFESLDGDIDFMECKNRGILSEYLETQSGQKLLKGLSLNEIDLDEYELIATFNLGDANESKKILLSTILQSFPLCVVREEESSYIMANNKGLAKGIVDVCNEDEIEILSLFLTGFEKYKVLTNFLFWASPDYKRARSSEILVKWDRGALLSLETLRKIKTVPIVWQTYLEGLDEIQVSKDDKDNGVLISFERMLEDVIEWLEAKKEIDTEENLVNVISLRGMKEYSISQEEEEEENEQPKTK